MGYYTSSMSNKRNLGLTLANWDEHTKHKTNTKKLGPTHKACDKLMNEQTDSEVEPNLK